MQVGMPGDHPSWGNITCPTITNTPRWTASPPDFLVTRVPLIANITYVSAVLVLPLHAHLIVKVQQGGLEASMIFSLF